MTITLDSLNVGDMIIGNKSYCINGKWLVVMKKKLDYRVSGYRDAPSTSLTLCHTNDYSFCTITQNIPSSYTVIRALENTYQ